LKRDLSNHRGKKGASSARKKEGESICRWKKKKKKRRIVTNRKGRGASAREKTRRTGTAAEKKKRGRNRPGFCLRKNTGDMPARKDGKRGKKSPFSGKGGLSVFWK